MELCRQLSYCRSITPGKGVFYFKTEEQSFVPLTVESVKIVGMKSGYSEAYQGSGELKAKDPKDLAYGNPHTVEACYVPPNVESIFCKFSLRVEANSLIPDRCDDFDVAETLKALLECYSRLDGFEELARRYCRNILIGNWLWRNRNNLGTRIVVKTSTGLEVMIEDASLLTWRGAWPERETYALTCLSEEFKHALDKKNSFWFAEVEAELKMSFCQEIFPSQAFTDRDDSNQSKHLCRVIMIDGQESAVLSPQKIGAAIQLIDDWWSDGDDPPVRIHEYGANRQFLIAHRHPSNHNDFYSLLKLSDQFLLLLEKAKSKEEIPNEVHYLVAVLIKGGLFQRGAV